jgi:hypothetical protein
VGAFLNSHLAMPQWNTLGLHAYYLTHAFDWDAEPVEGSTPYTHVRSALYFCHANGSLPTSERISTGKLASYIKTVYERTRTRRVMCTKGYSTSQQISPAAIVWILASLAWTQDNISRRTMCYICHRDASLQDLVVLVEWFCFKDMRTKEHFYHFTSSRALHPSVSNPRSLRRKPGYRTSSSSVMEHVFPGFEPACTVTLRPHASEHGGMSARHLTTFLPVTAFASCNSSANRPSCWDIDRQNIVSIQTSVGTDVPSVAGSMFLRVSQKHVLQLKSALF